MSELQVTPGGNPVCRLCGHWYGLGEKHECPPSCNFFWGSHGCDLDRGGHRVHQCGRTTPTPQQLELVAEGDLDPRTLGPCCQYDEDRHPGARVRWHEGGEAWGEWLPYGEGWYQ